MSDISNMNATLHTKFGTAKIHSSGYYVITSGKEGNNGKTFHRLIFEDFYGYIPEGFIVHHKDGNKLNNCILNLQLMSKYNHKVLHTVGKNNPMYGNEYTDEECQEISKQRNTSGYFRVYKLHCKKCKQGFTWAYRYYDKISKTRKVITSIYLTELEKKVKSLGLLWVKFDN